MFIKRTATDVTVVAVYVDDILVAGSNLAAIQHLKDFLHQLFNIKDLGHVHYFLDFEVSRSSVGFVLSQKKFNTKLLSDHPLPTMSLVPTPLPVTWKTDDLAVLY